MYGIWNEKNLVWNEMEWEFLIDMQYGKFLFHYIP